tara:strand:+ start:396 stop:551 length:156 start_codon:yes stop_codon:yes gene_type:complete
MEGDNNQLLRGARRQPDCEKEEQLLITRPEVSLEGMGRKLETGREGEEGIM